MAAYILSLLSLEYNFKFIKKLYGNMHEVHISKNLTMMFMKDVLV